MDSDIALSPPIFKEVHIREWDASSPTHAGHSKATLVHLDAVNSQPHFTAGKPQQTAPTSKLAEAAGFEKLIKKEDGESEEEVDEESNVPRRRVHVSPIAGFIDDETRPSPAHLPVPASTTGREVSAGDDSPEFRETRRVRFGEAITSNMGTRKMSEYEFTEYTFLTCGYFKPENPIRKLADRSQESSIFRWFIILLIILSCVSGVVLESVATSARVKRITTNVEFVMFSMFALDVILAIVSKGIWSTPEAYFRSKGNVTDVAVIMLSFVSLFLGGKALSVLRVFRAARPLMAMRHFIGVRGIIVSLRSATRLLILNAVLILLVMIIFVGTGVDFYRNSLTRQCHIALESKFPDQLSLVFPVTLCKNSSNQFGLDISKPCPIGTCATIESPYRFSLQTFDFFHAGLMSVMQIVSLDRWSHYMFPIMKSELFIFSGIWFVSIVATISLILLTLFTGVTAGTFSRIREIYEQSGFIRKENRKVEVFDYSSIFKPVLSSSKPLKSILKKKSVVLTSNLLETVEKDHVEKVDEWEADDVISDTQIAEPIDTIGRRGSQVSSRSSRGSIDGMGSDVGSETAAIGSFDGDSQDGSPSREDLLHLRKQASWQRKIAKITETGKFKHFIILVILLNIIFQALEYEGMSPSLSKTLEITDFLFASIFTIELFLRLLAHGVRVFRDNWVRLDLLIVIAAWTSIIADRFGVSFLNLSALRALRALRVVRVLHFFAEFFFILGAAVKSLRATGNVMLLTLMVITVYGMLGFSLLRNTYSDIFPDTRFHFDSFGVGMVTLFVISTGDKWTDPLYQSVTYNGWCALFFVSFYILLAWILYSLYIALVLENFAMSEAEAGRYRDRIAETRHNLAEFLDKLSRRMKNMPIFERASTALRDKLGNTWRNAGDNASDAQSLSTIASSNWQSMASGMTRVSRSSQGSLKSQSNLLLRDPFDLPSQLYYYYLQHLSTEKASRRRNIRGTLTKDRNEKEIKAGLLRVSELFGCKILKVPRFVMEAPGRDPDVNSLSVASKVTAGERSNSITSRDRNSIISVRDRINSFSSNSPSTNTNAIAVMAMTSRSDHGSIDDETPQMASYVNVLRKGSVTSMYTPISERFSKKNEHEPMIMDPEEDHVTPDNPIKRLRMMCRRIVGTLLFDLFMTGVVIASVVILTDDPPAEAELRLNVQSKKWLWWEITSLIIFTLEAALKITACRFWKGKYSYIRNPWNAVDFIILIFAYVSLVFPLTQALRLLRVAKPLRFLRRVDSVRFIVTAILRSVPNLIQVCIVQIYILFLFSLMGVSLFRGRLASCNDDSVDGKRECTTTYWSSALTSPSVSVLTPRSWERYRSHCDNVGACILLLSQVATADGWAGLMFGATDIRGRGLQPRQWQNPIAAGFFILFVIVVYLFMNNIFISVVIYNLSKHRYSLFKTPSQKMWINFKRQLANQRPVKNLLFKSTSRIRNICRVIAASTDYSIMTAVIVLLGVAFTIFTQSIRWDDEEPIPTLMTVVEVLYCAFFVGDCALKIIAYTFSVYWQFNSNKFDFCTTLVNLILTVAYILQFTRQAPFIAIVRGTRVIRILYIPRIIQGMDYLLDTLIIAIPPIFNTIVVLAVVFSTYAFIAKLFLGSIKYQTYLSRDVNYRRYAAAVFRLFVDFTQDDWADFMHDMRLQPPFCTQNSTFNDCGTDWVILYTCSFIVLMVYIILNIVFAIILDTFEQCFVPVDNLIGTTHVEEFKRLWSLYDPHAVGVLPRWRLAYICQRLNYHHNALAVSPVSDRYHFHVVLYHLFRQGGNGGQVQFRNVLRTLTVNSVKHDCFVTSEIRELLSLDRRADLELAQIQIASLWKTYWAYKKLVGGRNELVRSPPGIERVLRARNAVRAMKEMAKKIMNDGKNETLVLPYEDWHKIINAKLHFFRMKNEDLFSSKLRSREAGLVIDLTHSSIS